MLLLVVSLSLLLVVAICAYRTLYADDFAYQGRHQGEFKFWRGEDEATIQFVGVLTPSQIGL
jgi:hypothetical protein